MCWSEVCQFHWCGHSLAGDRDVEVHEWKAKKAWYAVASYRPREWRDQGVSQHSDTISMQELILVGDPPAMPWCGEDRVTFGEW